MKIKLNYDGGKDEPVGSENFTKEDFLPTGCTLLNLIISDRAFGGYAKGHYFHLVGDSASGKTFFSMNCFAEAVRSKHFEDYRLIYDNVEGGMVMDVARLFGQGVVDRMEPPCWDGDSPSNSETVEQFFFNVDDAINKDEPFVYVLDSMDGLESIDDRKKFDEHKKAHVAGKRPDKGSFGMAKAKANSVGLRRLTNGPLRKLGAILIIISQTRDNVDPFSFKRKTRSGGRALKFYSSCSIWTANKGKVKKTVRKKARQVGNKVKIHLEKNRITGKLHEIETAIYPSYGIDDIGTNVDYLLSEEWWKKRKQTILATELKIEATREKLVKMISQDRKLEKKLKRTVGKCWADVEEGKRLDLPPRYE